MKTHLSLLLLLVACHSGFTQNKWFEVYTDTLALNRDSEALTKAFQSDISKIDSTVNLNSPKSVFNAMGPFFNAANNTINLPIWDLAPPVFQDFCTTVMGTEDKGKELFGLFFNGFYIPHELGHALQFAADKTYDNDYDKEYNANIIGLLYWKHQGKSEELELCHRYAQNALEQIPNPFPAGADEKTYFTEHYQEFGAEPIKYAYVQFSQYVKAYEETTSMDFQTFIKNYLGED